MVNTIEQISTKKPAQRAAQRLLRNWDYMQAQTELFDITTFDKTPLRMVIMKSLAAEHPNKLVMDGETLDEYQYKAQLLGAGLSPDTELEGHNGLWTNVLNRQYYRDRSDMRYDLSHGAWIMSRGAFKRVMTSNFEEAETDRMMRLGFFSAEAKEDMYEQV